MDSDLLNLLLLPLLGGYIFCSKCAWTAFAARMADGQRLIYSSSVAGVLLLVGARAIELGLAAATSKPESSGYALTRILLAGELSAVAAGLLLFFLGFAPQLELGKRLQYRLAGAALALAPATLLTFIAPYNLTLLRITGGFAVVVGLMFAIASFVSLVARSAPHEGLLFSLRAALLVPALLALCTLVFALGPIISTSWPNFSSIRYSGLALLSTILGATLWMPANVVFTTRWAWARAHESGRTSGLERLLYRAFKAKLPVQLTLKEGKVYTGFILELPVPITRMEGGCIEFLPLSSGFRDPKTKDVTITTNYARVIADLTKTAADSNKAGRQGASTVQGDNGAAFRATPEIKAKLASLMKAVPLSEVQVASMYDNRYKKADFAIP